MKYLILLLTIFATLSTHGQTAGSGALSSIESKANAIENLQNQIAQIESNLKKWRLERSALDDLFQYRNWDRCIF